MSDKIGFGPQRGPVSLAQVQASARLAERLVKEATEETEKATGITFEQAAKAWRKLDGRVTRLEGTT